MVNFQNSQINQQEFEQLGEFLLNYPMVYSTSKFHLRKTHLPLDLPLKPDPVFKKSPASKVFILLQNKTDS